MLPSAPPLPPPLWPRHWPVTVLLTQTRLDAARAHREALRLRGVGPVTLCDALPMRSAAEVLQ